MKHGTAPQQLGRGLCHHRVNRRVVLLPQLAVDGDVLLNQRPGRLDLGRAGENRRDDPAQELVVERNGAFLERFREGQVIELADRFLARDIPRKELHRRVHVLVVAEGKERNTQPGIAACRQPLDLHAGDREARVLEVADSHARHDVLRRGAVDDHLGAAKVDVVLGRDDRDARLLEANRHLPGRLGRQGPHAPHLARGRDDDGGRPGLNRQPGHRRRAGRRLHVRRSGGGRGKRRPRAVLLERELHVRGCG